MTIVKTHIAETLPTKIYQNPTTKKPVLRWNHIPELIDRETLEDLLRTYLTIAGVARHLNCTRSHVISAMKAHGIERQKIIISDSMKKKLRI